MATRFGAISPYQRYTAKVRWLVSGLASMVVCLTLTIGLILTSEEELQAKGEDTKEETITYSPSTVSILMPIKRIEKGSQLQANFFRNVSWDPDSVPEGSLYASQLNEISGKYAKHIIYANLPITKDAVSEEKPRLALDIPVGYRGITIDLNKRNSQSGLLKANDRVDLLWTYKGGDNIRKIKTIAHFVKILEISGNSPNNNSSHNNNTVTLQVTERDSKHIELARSIGSLSMTLVGETGYINDTQNPHETITEGEIIGILKNAASAKIVDGIMTTTDPKTGRQVKFELANGRWVRL